MAPLLTAQPAAGGSTGNALPACRPSLGALLLLMQESGSPSSSAARGFPKDPDKGAKFLASLDHSDLL